MQVFVLGGTGTVGTAIVAELVRRNHKVEALSRSEAADERLILAGATPVRGSLTEPDEWVDAAISSGAVVQAVATFNDDMAEVDAKAMTALVEASARRTNPTRLLYTGGCWLYGETGAEVATEERSFEPLSTFSWMVEHAQMLLDAPSLRTAIVHPAMVYDVRHGGAFQRFLADAKAGRKIEIWGSETTRWPLIESTDLARAYCDLLERPDLGGHFNVSAEDGVTVGRIASVIAQAHGSPTSPIIRSVEDAMKEHGEWAKGPTLDQQMSAQKVQRTVGWQPNFTDFAEPISRWIAGSEV